MIREPTKHEMAVTEAVRRHTVRASLSAKVLSTDEVSIVAIEKWQKGERQPTVAKLRALLPNALREDRAAALEWISDMLGLREVGVVLALAPGVQPQLGDAREAAADVTEAAADLQHEVRTSLRDGAIDAAELARIANAAQRVQRETAEVPAVVHALGTLERPLAGVGR